MTLAPTGEIRLHDTEGPASDAVAALTARVRERFGDSTVAVLFYGSVLRDRLEVEDGLLDLIAIVDGYGKAYGGWVLPLLNLALAPNVFYLETDVDTEAPDPDAEEGHGSHRARAKYATISLSHLRHKTGPRCLQSYFWGRLAQPVVVAYTRDAEAQRAVDEVLARAITTFATCSSKRLTGTFDAERLWSEGLAACYRTEFRPEQARRAQDLTESGLTRYRAVCDAVARKLAWTRVPGHEVPHYTTPTSALRRGWSHTAWWARRVQGRTLHVLRLMKAAFTFRGGLEYLLWKIERHSGVKVDVSERTRRHPLIFGWWTLWRVRRKGGFR